MAPVDNLCHRSSFDQMGATDQKGGVPCNCADDEQVRLVGREVDGWLFVCQFGPQTASVRARSVRGQQMGTRRLP